MGFYYDGTDERLKRGLAVGGDDGRQGNSLGGFIRTGNEAVQGPNGAQKDTARDRDLGRQAQNTVAPTTAWDSQYGSLANDARQGGTDALTLMQQRANGIHTANDAMMNRGNAQATATQRSMLMGGRGAAAMAMAPQQIAGVASRMSMDNANNKAFTDAQDTAVAQNQLAQGYGQMRGQDATLQNAYDSRSAFDQSIQGRQRALNDQGQLAYENMGFGATNAQLAAEEAANDIDYNTWKQQSDLDQRATQDATNRAIGYAGAAVNAVSGAAGNGAVQGGGGGGGGQAPYNYQADGNTNINRTNPYDTTSDARAKENIKEESSGAAYARRVLAARDAASSQMLDNVRPVSFNYKPGFDNPGQTPGSKNYGVLAQDLERSPMGASLLAAPDGTGVKKVDLAKAAMANLAASADLHQRLKAVESKGTGYAAKVNDLRAAGRDISKSLDAQFSAPSAVTPARMGQRISPEKAFNDYRNQNEISPNVARMIAETQESGAYNDYKRGNPAVNPAEVDALRNQRMIAETQESGAYNDYRNQRGISPAITNAVTSDERVKEAVQTEGVPAPVAYGERKQELADEGDTRQLETLTREGSKVGLEGPRPVQGNQMGYEPNDSFKTQSDMAVDPRVVASAPPEMRKSLEDVKNMPIKPVGQVLASLAAPVPEPPAPKVDPASLQQPVPTTQPSNTTAEREPGPLPIGMFGGPAYQTSAAHYQDQIGPAAWAALSDAQKASLTAADNIKNRMGEQYAKDEGVANQQYDEAKGLEKRGNDINAARNVEADRRIHEMDGDIKALANYHEDPNHFWNSRSTAQKIMGTIGIMLGGFGQGLRGGSNPAMEQINNAINRDIEAQRSDYKANSDSLAAKRSAYGMAMEKFHNDFEAVTFTRLAAHDRVEAQAKQMAAQHGGAETANNLDKFMAEQKDLTAKQKLSYMKYVQAATVKTAYGTQMDALQKEYRKYNTNVLEKGETPIDFRSWAQGQLGGAPATVTWGQKGGPGGKAALDAQERQTSSNEVNQQLNGLLKSPVLDDIGMGTAIGNKLGQRIAPDSSKTAQKVNSLNLMVLGAAGKVLKDSEGRISPIVLQELEHFQINPGDTKEIGQEKIKGALDFINATARQSGSVAPEPNASTSAPSTSTPTGFKAAK